MAIPGERGTRNNLPGHGSVVMRYALQFAAGSSTGDRAKRTLGRP